MINPHRGSIYNSTKYSCLFFLPHVRYMNISKNPCTVVLRINQFVYRMGCIITDEDYTEPNGLIGNTPYDS